MPSQRVEIPVGRREAVSKSPFVSSQSAINCFVERDPEPGVPDSIHGGPGLVEFADIGDGDIRGTHLFNGALLAVAGDSLYSVDANGAETSIGPIAGYDPVVISDNGAQAAIVSDSTSYLWDGATLSAINDPDFRRASSVDFISQVLLFSEHNSGRYFTSELADGSSYNALDIATAETRPDKLVRVLVSANEALLFGELGVEGLYFSGKPTGVPLSPTQTNLEYGLAGRDAVCKIDNTVAWLAHDMTIRTLRDGSPLAIADPAITSMIQGWTDPGSARAFAFSIRGHEWMAIRHSQGCVLWDATTQLWHRRESHGSPTWRVANSIRAYGHVLLGDASVGKLWRLDPDAQDEGGEPMVRTLVSRTLGPAGLPFTLEAIELEAESGVGLATGQGSDPKIWMQLSRDGGRTYGTRLERSMGTMGNRNVRVCWSGPFGDFPPHGGVIKFACSDPVRLTITKAWAEITPARP